MISSPAPPRKTRLRQSSKRSSLPFPPTTDSTSPPAMASLRAMPPKGNCQSNNPTGSDRFSTGVIGMSFNQFWDAVLMEPKPQRAARSKDQRCLTAILQPVAIPWPTGLSLKDGMESVYRPRPGCARQEAQGARHAHQRRTDSRPTGRGAGRWSNSLRRIPIWMPIMCERAQRMRRMTCRPLPHDAP